MSVIRFETLNLPRCAVRQEEASADGIPAFTRVDLHRTTANPPKGGTQSYWLKSHVLRDMVALPDERRPWACDIAHRFKETSSP